MKQEPEAQQEYECSETAPPADSGSRRGGFRIFLKRAAIGFCVVFTVMSLIFYFGIFSLLKTAADSVSGMNVHLKKTDCVRSGMAKGFEYVGASDKQILHVRIKGEIAFSDPSGLNFGGQGAETYVRQITAAVNDDRIDGILLEIDSPGGEITAADVIRNELIKFRQSRSGRFIVTLLGGMAASGGYYAAAASDVIIAHPTTITGSIGVIIMSFNIKALADNLGIRNVSVKSGKNKDLMNPFSEIIPEHRQILQDVVDEGFNRFVKIVAEGRGLPETRVRAIADGRVFTAGQALKLGLVDDIGYYDDALGKIAERLGDKDFSVVTYSRDIGFWELISSPSFLGSCAAETAAAFVRKQGLRADGRVEMR